MTGNPDLQDRPANREPPDLQAQMVPPEPQGVRVLTGATVTMASRSPVPKAIRVSPDPPAS